jgi:hypothetical protein
LHITIKTLHLISENMLCLQPLSAPEVKSE